METCECSLDCSATRQEFLRQLALLTSEFNPAIQRTTTKLRTQISNANIADGSLRGGCSIKIAAFVKLLLDELAAIKQPFVTSGGFVVDFNTITLLAVTFELLTKSTECFYMLGDCTKRGLTVWVGFLRETSVPLHVLRKIGHFTLYSCYLVKFVDASVAKLLLCGLMACVF